MFILNIVVTSVPPRAKDPSEYSWGTALREVTVTLTIVGRIITASTSMADRRFAPDER